MNNWNNFVEEEKKNLTEEDKSFSLYSYKFLKEVFERQKVFFL